MHSADLHGQSRRNAVIVLAQLQTVVLGRLDQVPAAPVKKSAVGGVGNGLGHDGGAYDNPLCVGLLDDTTAPGGIDAGRQRRLHVFFNALSPACEAGRVDGQLGLQVGLTAEELPVRVLHPDLDLCLVRGVEGVLRVQKASDQARSQGWAATTEGERHREGALDLLPVEQSGQPDQWVLHVDLLVQPWTEQLGRLRLRRLWTHRTPRGNLQENRYGQNHTLQTLRHQSAELHVRSRACRLFRAD